MEIWISTGNKKDLKKSYPFLREYGVIDVRELALSLGHETASGLDEHSSFILNNEISKRLEAFNNSRRFYRVLFLVEDCREELAHQLLDYSVSSKLKYEAVYLRKEEEFVLVCQSY
jgi:hypothetical protein